MTLDAHLHGLNRVEAITSHDFIKLRLHHRPALDESVAACFNVFLNNADLPAVVSSLEAAAAVLQERLDELVIQAERTLQERPACTLTPAGLQAEGPSRDSVRGNRPQRQHI